MKYVANLLVAIHNVASVETLVLGMKAGLPPQLLYDQVKIGAGNSRVFELRALDNFLLRCVKAHEGTSYRKEVKVVVL
jgi:3-hydroxyisobutyrate dehydrogenase-like beta-hydroxyacid dehydrogenase